jgi:hypothetical protein
MSILASQIIVCLVWQRKNEKQNVRSETGMRKQMGQTMF